VQKSKQYLILLLILFAFVSCDLQKPEPIKIAISKGLSSKSYSNYGKWLRKIDPNIDCVDLYFREREQAMEILKECDGLLLSGGPDVDPTFYDKAWDSSRCSIDYRRDTLEMELIKLATKLDIPILGVCRGEQILNVAYGGSLIVDIPEDVENNITHQNPNTYKCYHKVEVTDGSLLNEICGIIEGEVNTNHHQAVDALSDVFVASAYSADGVIEAFEWKNRQDKPFLLAVQWHPERLDTNNKLSMPLGRRFVSEVKKNKKLKANY
jgi:putative glutamine amidotransferase